MPEPQSRVPAAGAQSFELQRHAAGLFTHFLTRWDLPGDHIDHLILCLLDAELLSCMF